jgi:molybdate transport system substrate-binding protein
MGSAWIPGTVRELGPFRCYLGNKGDEYVPGGTRTAAGSDISTSEAFKRSMLDAKSITHGNPATGGISGVHVVKVLERLEIAEEMKAKTVLLDKAGLAGVPVADGKAEIVIQQIQELVVVPGIEVVGPLPEALQDTVTYQSVIIDHA